MNLGREEISLQDSHVNSRSAKWWQVSSWIEEPDGTVLGDRENVNCSVQKETHFITGKMFRQRERDGRADVTIAVNNEF